MNVRHTWLGGAIVVLAFCAAYVLHRAKTGHVVHLWTIPFWVLILATLAGEVLVLYFVLNIWIPAGIAVKTVLATGMGCIFVAYMWCIFESRHDREIQIWDIPIWLYASAIAVTILYAGALCEHFWPEFFADQPQGGT